MNIFEIDQSSASEYGAYLLNFPQEKFTHGLLDKNVKQNYIQFMNNLLFSKQYKQEILSTILDDTSDEGGYAIIDFKNIFKYIPHDLVSSLLISFSTLIGTPMHVFQSLPPCIPIGVNIEGLNNNSEGIGYQSFHIDIVNAEFPPDYTCLLCIKSDTNLGGLSIISNFNKSIRELTAEELGILQLNIFHYGTLFDAKGVGKELKTFPILKKLPDNSWKIRYTEKALLDLENPKAKEALIRFDSILRRNQTAIKLDNYQLLILNHAIVCHGRTELGIGQNLIPIEKRRLIYQIFLRS